ncbi:MAG TPA: C39 family peptidase [Marmoricola sp.]|nr:C39 family peptidase [Marmoricola sp.]
MKVRSVLLSAAAITALTCGYAGPAHATSGGGWAHAKQKADASGKAGVPANWNPATAPAPTKAVPSGTSGSVAPYGVSTSNSIATNQVSQKTSYYCGPAAVHEALNVQGIGATQSNLASAMGTTTNGTAWYTGSSYPVPTTLNNKLGRSFYVPVNVSYSPTSTEEGNFQSRVVSDINSGYAVVGNAYEVAGGPHLVGHPTNETIYHYFEIRGFSNSGASTMYEDSVHGATSISWYASVPAYSTMDSSKITTIVGGRGYVW